MITADQLTVTYPFTKEPAMAGFTSRIRSGENVLVIGPSGSGKSTLTLAVQGILPRSVEADVAGELQVDGEIPSHRSIMEAAAKTGVLFQDPDTQFCMAVIRDELAFTMENRAIAQEEMDSRMQRALKAVGMQAHIDTAIHALSGGMKQKAAMASLWCQDPDIWIIDEPMSQLDPAARRSLAECLQVIKQDAEKTLIMIEHQLDEVVELADRLIVMDDRGSVFADGAPRDVLTEHTEAMVSMGIRLPSVTKTAYALQNKHPQLFRRMPVTIKQWQEGTRHLPAEIINRVLPVPAGSGRIDDKNIVLEGEKLSFRYKGTKVIDELSCRFYKGEFHAVVGRNGSGKSTLFQLLTGWLKQEQGDVSLFGEKLTRKSMKRIASAIGIVFQQPEHQFIHVTVEKELRHSMEIEGWKEEAIKERVEELLDLFALQHKKMSHPFQLSQGQKRRLSTAVMLTSSQSILLLDEPMFGLDQRNTDALLMILRKLQEEGKTIVMITHDLNVVYSYASRVIAIDEGVVYYEGDTASFFHHPDQIHRAGGVTPACMEMRQEKERLIYV